MTSQRSQTLKVLLACLISGIVAGFLTSSQCRAAETACRVAALQYLYSDPVPWTIWAHWVNWLPGAIFGGLFAVAALGAAIRSQGRGVLLYALASTAAYVVAGLLFSAFLSLAGGEEYNLVLWVWPAGFTAGLIGALLLSVGANLFLRNSNSTGGAFSRSWLPAVVGGTAGVAFVFICIYGEQQAALAFPAAFSVWQVAVGLALAPRTRQKTNEMFK